MMKHFSVLCDIIQCAVEGEKEKARGYSELLIERIRRDGTLGDGERERYITRIEKILRGDKGQIIYLAGAEAVKESPDPLG